MNPNTYGYGLSSMNGCIPCPGNDLLGGRNFRAGSGQRQSSRDSFNWPGSNGGQGISSGFGVTRPQYYVQTPVYGHRNQQWPGASSPVPQAYMQVPRYGQDKGASGEFVPIQTSSRNGFSMGSMPQMNTPQPMTIKLTAPPGAGANGQPIAFKLDPSMWLGAGQVQRK